MSRPVSTSRTEVVRHLDATVVREVFDLVSAATDADGVRPLNEHVMLHLRYGGDADVRHVLRYDGDVLMGYGHLDVTDPVEGSSAEMVVHPGRRKAGHGRAVVSALVEASPDGRLRLWAHGEHPGAQRLAEGMGFVRLRVLWQMRRSLYAPLPEPVLPEGVTIRTFRPGEDDEEWVALNASAFASHPEQGQLSLDDLRTRMREPWFDPAGFFLAHRGQAMVGFHWTKVHGGNGTDGQPADTHRHGHEPVGEVYVVGVDPAAQGHGLGRALTLVGLRHLRGVGLPLAMLYVEADNAPAIRVYESLGFTHWDTDVMYRFGPLRPGGPTRA
ncbi:MAG: mycothiol synthase [Actinomycetes bacterium]